MMESIIKIAEKYVTYNSTLKILICRKEQHCISPGANKTGESKNYGIIDHFYRSEHKDLTRKDRMTLNQYISNLDIAKPRNVMIPSPEDRPIAGLELHQNGAECLICNELRSNECQMKKHCQEHGWKTGKDPLWKKQAVQTFFKGHGKELKYAIY